MVKPFEIPTQFAAPDAASRSASKKGALVSNAISEDAVPRFPTDFGGSWHTTRKGGRYIPFLNPDDGFAQLLLTVQMNSPTTALCIGSKTDYVAGGGVVLTEGAEDKDWTEWAGKVNNKKQSLHDVVHAACENIYRLGNCFVEVARGEVAGEKFVKVYVNSFMDCRLMQPDDEWEEPNLVAKTRDFRKEGFVSLRKDRYLEIPIYDSDNEEDSWVEDDNGVERTIIFLKNEMVGYDNYGMPSNITGLQYAILEYKSASYNIDNFDNNLVMGGIISMEAGMSQEEATGLARNITATHRGDGKRNKWAVLATEQGIKGINVHPFDTQTDGSFIEFDKHVEKKIILANEWDAVLAGIHKDSGLGNGGSGYIREIFNVKYETVIQPMQGYLLEHLVLPVMKIAGEFLSNGWDKHGYDLVKVVPTSMAGDVDVNKVMTKNEGRKAIGLEEKEGPEWEEVIDNGKANALPKQNDTGDVQD